MTARSFSREAIRSRRRYFIIKKHLPELLPEPPPKERPPYKQDASKPDEENPDQ